MGNHSLLQGIFPIQGLNSGIEPRSPALQADSLPAEPQGKPLLVTNCSYFRNNIVLVAISCGPTGPKTTLPRVFFLTEQLKSHAVLHLVNVKFSLERVTFEAASPKVF